MKDFTLEVILEMFEFSRLGARSFREAQQLSVLIIVPIMGLVVGQMFGFLLLIPTVILILFAIFVVVDLIILKIGLSMFEREEILSRIR